jgi:hypothetical protein
MGQMDRSGRSVGNGTMEGGRNSIGNIKERGRVRENIEKEKKKT